MNDVIPSVSEEPGREGHEARAGERRPPSALATLGMTRAVIGLALTAAAVRLAPLGWLHPLNWDEIEFYRVTSWIAQGRVPFRDFWEHHTPLSWYLFAPVTLLSKSPGVDAILALRWAQIPVWIATFWLANVFMRNAGISRFTRWAAMALALSSSFLMIAAVEYRLDPLSCAFYMAALVAWQRNTSRSMFLAGVLFCLVGLTNMRLGPLLVVTVLLLRVIDPRERKWRGNPRANWIFAGGIVTLALALLWFVATDSLGPLWRQLLFENYIGDKYAREVLGQFFHRLLVAFGVRLIGSDTLWEIGAVDAGGIAILLIGFTGLALTLRNRWRAPDDLFVVALLQVTSLLIIGGMNFIYNYHFEIVVIMMLPFLALMFERIPRRGVVIAILGVAWCVNAFASFFRGKELDLAYQDFVMREVHARSRPDEKVWGGMGWALRREPAYHFWFLPDMTRILVQRRLAAPYALQDVLRDPPAVVVFDHSILVWLTIVQRELAPYFVRHYIPVWRNLWIPGMNVRLRPERPRFEWIVPRDGTYRLFASNALARHTWFRDPFYVGAYEAHDVARSTLTLPAPAAHPELRWRIDGKPADVGAGIMLREGQRVAVEYGGKTPLGVVLLSGNDTVLFRQPPSGATLEASTTRLTHVPNFGYRIQP